MPKLVHSPLPWNCREKMSGMTIFSETKVIGQIKNNYDNSEANAEYICLAANHFEEAVELLKKIGGGDTCCDAINGPKCSELAKAFLAKLDKPENVK